MEPAFDTLGIDHRLGIFSMEHRVVVHGIGAQQGLNAYDIGAQELSAYDIVAQQEFSSYYISAFDVFYAKN